MPLTDTEVLEIGRAPTRDDLLWRVVDWFDALPAGTHTSATLPPAGDG